MDYRKLTIADQEYEYVIGHSHVKVKGLGSVTIEQIIENSEIAKSFLDNMEFQFMISPSIVKEIILTKELYTWK